MLQKWKTIEPCQKKKLPFVNFQSHVLTPSPLWIKHTDINKKCLLKPDIFPINEKLVRLEFTKIRTFNLSICFFLSSCNSFGISSNILKFVSLRLRPHLNTRSLSEYLKKRAITVRLPFPLPVLGFPILCTRWNSMPFASSIPRASSIKLTRTFLVSSAGALSVGWGFKRFRYPFKLQVFPATVP